MSLTVVVVVGGEPCVQPRQVNLTTYSFVAVVMTLTCNAKCTGKLEAVTPWVGTLNLYYCRLCILVQVRKKLSIDATLAPWETQCNKPCWFSLLRFLTWSRLVRRSTGNYLCAWLTVKKTQSQLGSEKRGALTRELNALLSKDIQSNIQSMNPNKGVKE